MGAHRFPFRAATWPGQSWVLFLIYTQMPKEIASNNTGAEVHVSKSAMSRPSSITRAPRAGDRGLYTIFSDYICNRGNSVEVPPVTPKYTEWYISMFHIWMHSIIHEEWLPMYPPKRETSLTNTQRLLGFSLDFQKGKQPLPFKGCYRASKGEL